MTPALRAYNRERQIYERGWIMRFFISLSSIASWICTDPAAGLARDAHGMTEFPASALTTFTNHIRIGEPCRCIPQMMSQAEQTEVEKEWYHMISPSIIYMHSTCSQNYILHAFQVLLASASCFFNSWQLRDKNKR